MDRADHGEPVLPETIARELVSLNGDGAVTGVAGRLQELKHDLEEARAAHEAAQRQVDELPLLHQQLVRNAAWCDEHVETMAEQQAALAVAESEVRAAQTKVSESEVRLASVAEQEGAAEAVLEEAHRQLLELDVAGQSENDVRRSLERANQAAREANAAADRARHDAEASTAALASAEARRAEVEAERASLRQVAVVDPARVAAALEQVEQAPSLPADDVTLALADDLDRKSGVLAGMGQPEGVPTAEELAAAEEEARRAREQLDELRRPPPSEAPAWWDELARLHAAVVDAEAAAGATLARPAARRRLEEALTAERALLDELGYSSHLDALLSGGRPSGRRTDPDAIPDAEAQLAVAERCLTALRTARAAAVVYRRARADVMRLKALGSALIGTPGFDVTAAELREPRPDPKLRAELREALATAGVQFRSDDLLDEARTWLQDQATAASRLATLDAERDGLVARTRTLVPEAEAATTHAEESSRAARAARRQVEVLEAELVNRMRPTADPAMRAATAAALRDHIAALEARIGTAKMEAESVHLSATTALGAATARCDAARRDLDDLVRRAASAAALLSDDPDRDRTPSHDLEALAAALRAEYAAIDSGLVDLAAAIGDAAARVKEAQEALAAHGSGPAPDCSTADRVAALRRVLDPTTRRSDVVVDPLDGVEPASRSAVLEALIDIGTERPLVVVATDPDLLAWAETLPADVGLTVSEHALDLDGVPADEPSTT